VYKQVSLYFENHRIGDIIVSVLTSSMVDRGSNQRLWNWYLLCLR